MFLKKLFIKYTENERLLLSATFMAKFELLFVSTQENPFSQRFHFNTNRKEHRLFYKTTLGIFKIAIHLRDQHVFMPHSLEILNIFNAVTSKQSFWKMKTFQKTEVTLVESTKIENHHFHTILICQKPMLRQIEWGVQNGPITKNGNLPLTTLFF